VCDGPIINGLVGFTCIPNTSPNTAGAVPGTSMHGGDRR
jgi:hypothetical protein